MQELRLVAVSEDGSYAVLVTPGSGGRFALPIDDRLRIVARGQFSRLAQYEIEVESPLRPKEIQDRIRAGETAEEIADAAGVPIERVRRFEGPVLAERAYRAQEAQRATLRQSSDSGPGRPLLEVVSERLRELGVDPEEAEWDSRKRPAGDWQVQLAFSSGSRPYLAEWLFDPRRRHVSPADETAARLCLPEADLPDTGPRQPATATVTPIASRLGAGDHEARRQAGQAPASRSQPAPPPRQAPQHRSGQRPSAQYQPGQYQPGQQQPGQQQPGRQQPAQRPAAQHQPGQQRPAQRESAPRESAQRESAQRESAQRESAQYPPGQRGAGHQAAPSRSPQPRSGQPGAASQQASAQQQRAARAAAQQAGSRGEQDAEQSGQAAQQRRERPARKAAGGRSRRASVPSWDEIMLGTSRNTD
jgi:DUF3071 family protein